MAKGMNKHKDTKKPKKEVPKTIAAAPSTKNAVNISTTPVKSK